MRIDAPFGMAALRFRFAQPRDHCRQQRMLGGVHFFRQRFEGIVRLDAHWHLIKDWSAVDVERDAVHGAAGDFTPRRKACPIPSSPGKLGSKLGCRLIILPSNWERNGSFSTR